MKNIGTSNWSRRIWKHAIKEYENRELEVEEYGNKQLEVAEYGNRQPEVEEYSGN